MGFDKGLVEGDVFEVESLGQGFQGVCDLVLRSLDRGRAER